MKTKKETVMLWAVFALVLVLGFFAGIYSSTSIYTSTPTAQIAKDVANDAERKTYAYSLNDRVTNFFEVYAVEFPRGTCTRVIEELYSNIAYPITDTTSGFKTTAKERIATINFGVETLESLGTIDLVKGKTLTGKDTADSFLTMHAESIVRLPREDRRTFLSMELYGESKELLKITRGKFSTPSIDCEFESQNGVADCKCVTHALEGVVTS